MDAAFRKELFNDIDKALNQLQGLWNDCGFNETNQSELRSDAKHHLLDLLQDMVAVWEENKIKIVESIENLMKEAAQLNLELGVTIPIGIVCEYESLPLCEVEADLKARIEDSKIIRQQRLSRYKELLNKEQNICQSMEIECRQHFSNAVPTDEQILDFELYIDSKQTELETLKKSFNETRTRVLNIMKELEIVPLLDFEKYIVECDEETFKFSKKNMTSIKELHHSLEQKLEDTKTQAIELRETLTQLWDRIYEKYEARTAFIAAHSGCSAPTIEALKKEIHRCEERKLQNIKVFIDKIREEIQVFWMKCCYGEMQRSKFLPFNSSCYTEDLFELHELELDRLKNFYDCNREIYELMEKRQKLWILMEDLENRTRDQNRLFDNRGCQLLHEEKDRKTIERDLPKIESKLKLLVKEFENDSGEPFLFHDRNISTLMGEQWDEFKKKKETEKSARRMRGAETEIKPTPNMFLTPSPNKFLTRTPNKLRGCASASCSKMLKLTDKTPVKADLNSVCGNIGRSTRFGSQLTTRVFKEFNDNGARTPGRRQPLKDHNFLDKNK